MATDRGVPWLWLDGVALRTERRQLAEEGRDASRLRRAFERLIDLGDDRLAEPANQRKTEQLLDEAQQLPLRKGYAFREPSDLVGIRGLRARGPRRYARALSGGKLHDRVLGAWLGRCAGCLLGKPVEGVRTPELWGFLKATRQWPLGNYIRFGVRGKARDAYPGMAARKRFDTLDHMPCDDDTNYTVLGLLVAEECGPGFRSRDVAEAWLKYLPLMATCTAERVAYRNVATNMWPPASASYRNPYREWIGAQIRADAFGYVNVGLPEQAAEFAWRDASVSHVKNGIYGEMLMAATIAAAPHAETMDQLIRIGLSEIPRTSRLCAEIERVLEWRGQNVSYDEAVGRIHERWDERDPHGWCHTISNAVICAVALLWGEEDFGQSVCRAVQPGFDTDCNGATVGSILGMRLGVEAIPAEWTDRLNDTLRTDLAGHHAVRISEIARRTCRAYKANRKLERP